MSLSASSQRANLSSTIGLLPLRMTGTTPQTGFYIPKNVDGDSSEFQLSPTDLIDTSDRFSMGPTFNDMFGEIPEPDDYVRRTKQLGAAAMNGTMQFKPSANPKFTDFFDIKDSRAHSGFKLSLLPFNYPFGSNAFSTYFNAVSLGNHIVGLPNLFVESELLKNAPLLEVFDGKEYDKDILSKPYNEVGKPTGLSDDDALALMKRLAPASKTSTTTSTGASSAVGINASNLSALSSLSRLSNAGTTSTAATNTALTASTTAAATPTSLLGGSSTSSPLSLQTSGSLINSSGTVFTADQAKFLTETKNLIKQYTGETQTPGTTTGVGTDTATTNALTTQVTTLKSTVESLSSRVDQLTTILQLILGKVYPNALKDKSTSSSS